MVGGHRHLGGGLTAPRLPHLPDDDDGGGGEENDQHQVHAGDAGPPLQLRRSAGVVSAGSTNRPSGSRIGFRSLIVRKQVLDVRRLAGLIIVAGASTGTVIRGLIAILARPLIGELGLSGRFTRVVVTSGQLGQLLVGPGLQVLRSGGEEGRELLPMRPVVLRFHRPRPYIIPLRRSSLRDCARSRPLPRPRHLLPLGMCCSGTAGPTSLLTSTPRSASWPERAQSVAWLRMEIE